MEVAAGGVEDETEERLIPETRDALALRHERLDGLLGAGVDAGRRSMVIALRSEMRLAS